MYKTITLPVGLYGCETWSLTLREGSRLRVCENRVLRSIFGPKRDVWSRWRYGSMHHLHPVQATSNIPIIKYATMILDKRLLLVSRLRIVTENVELNKRLYRTNAHHGYLIRYLDKVENTMPDGDAVPEGSSGCCISDNTRWMDLDKT
jgi:hypothetical protein